MMKIKVTSISVDDQEKALRFYTDTPSPSLPHEATHDEKSTSPQSNCGEVSNPSQYEEVFMSHPEKKGTQESAKSTAVINKKSKGFTDEERAAMKERAKELKAEARANKNKAEGESDVLARIAEMPEPEREI